MIQESVKAFHWSAHYEVNSDDDVPNKDTGHLYIQRQEPSGASSLLVSTDFKNVRVLFNEIEEFWVKGDYMFATKTTVNQRAEGSMSGLPQDLEMREILEGNKKVVRGKPV